MWRAMCRIVRELIKTVVAGQKKAKSKCSELECSVNRDWMK
jgi:hypothetical protein